MSAGVCVWRVEAEEATMTVIQVRGDGDLN